MCEFGKCIRNARKKLKGKRYKECLFNNSTIQQTALERYSMADFEVAEIPAYEVYFIRNVTAI